MLEGALLRRTYFTAISLLVRIQLRIDDDLRVPSCYS